MQIVFKLLCITEQNVSTDIFSGISQENFVSGCLKVIKLIFFLWFFTTDRKIPVYQRCHDCVFKASFSEQAILEFTANLITSSCTVHLQNLHNNNDSVVKILFLITINRTTLRVTQTNTPIFKNRMNLIKFFTLINHKYSLSLALSLSLSLYIYI